ncbi:MAG: ABC transporter substrate-binding protein, partial [Catonella sp.]|uniref:ABC transporter substrate-binding protein n=1 Tax=Catonella sp. TaxID=2382125 RepID=UPI003FA01B36
SAGSKPASSAKTSVAATGNFTDNGGHELTVWCWDQAFNIYAMKEAEKIYQKKDPQFKLNIEEVRSDDVETKVTTAASSGDLSTLPDIFLMQDNSFQKYTSNFNNVFLGLNDSGINFKDFGEAKQAYSTLDGVHYGVPFDNGAVIGGYRIDILEKAGLKADDFKDITWSKFLELGKQVKEKTNTPMLTVTAGTNDLIMMMLQSAGSSMFKEDGSLNIVDNEVLRKALGIYQELYKAGVLVEVTDWDQYIAAIQSGSTAAVINGCWIIGSITAAKDLSGKWAINNMPRFDDVEGATNYSNNGGSSWAITSKSENQKLAIDFLNTTFAGSVELYETILPSAGALTTYLPAGNSDVYSKPQEFFGGKPIYSLITEFAGKIPSNITGTYYYDARNAVSVGLSNVIQKGADIEDELKAAQETVEFNMGG